MDAKDRIIWAQTSKGARIGTAFDHLGALRGKRSGLLAWLIQQSRSIGFDLKTEPWGEVRAEVNHGRWIARCQCCGGAEEVAWQEPVFFCLSCGNADNDSHVMSVVFQADKKAIESLLLMREIENRNWHPGETVESLQQENKEHGL
jgi:hypothetical protein